MNTLEPTMPLEAAHLVRPMRRKLFLQLHRYAGLFIALFLTIAGATGALIAFYSELDRALNPSLYHIIERPGPVLSAEALAKKVREQYPHAFINLMTLNRATGDSVRIRLTPLIDGETGQSFALQLTEIFVDPFDGRILGGRERGVFRADRAHLMPFIYRVHYTLYMPDKWGVWLMGVVAIVWLLDCFVGMYLTLPKRIRSTRKSWWQRWKPAWVIKRGAGNARLVFDSHRAGGLWFWIVLIVMALTSVYFNLTNEVFRPVLSAIAPLSPTVKEALQHSPQAALSPTISFDDAIERAQSLRTPTMLAMEPAYVGLTPDASGIFRVRFADIGRGDRNWHFRYENLFLDGADGNLLLRVNYENGTAADRFILWQYPLHSGQVFGFWGRVFIAATGLVVALLSVTGVMLWLKKRRSRSSPAYNFSRFDITMPRRRDR